MSQSKLEQARPIYFPAFDWLRLVLAMTVALSHDGVPMDHNAPNFAVQIFFALSGWLIGGILFDSTKQDLPRFYFNRATRIWAPYYFSVALIFAVSLLKEPIDWHWIEYLFYDLTYTHNWFISPRILEIQKDLPLGGSTNHFWSLSVEEQFYLFAPLLILFFARGRSIVLWAAIAALAVTFKTFYGAIALGVFAVALQRRYGDWHLNNNIALSLGIALIGCVAAYLVKPEAYLYIAPIASVLIVLLLARPGTKSTLGAFVGGISYPLYLNHWIGIFAAHEIVEMVGFIGRWSGVWLGAILNIGVASVLFLAIDEQVRKRRNRLFSTGRGWAAALTAYGLVVLGAVGGIAIFITRL
ncbi:acyltransferase family protein [Hyphococcus sp. DH-69]|uniref:acyltransferase family protein n=1 Tax=Hyphococcus formosus TaxID=3143534 RepID=UPI00398B179B